MVTLLTRDNEKAEELNAELAETVFGSAEQFVKLYSDGWINRGNDDIKEIAQKVTDIYQNIQLKGRDIVFVSQTETMVDDVIGLLRPWKYITKIKRAAEDADSEIYLLSDNSGYLFVKNKEGDFVKLTTERFFRNSKEGSELYRRFSSYFNAEPEGEDVSEQKGSEEEDFEAEIADLNEEENYGDDASTEENEDDAGRAYKFKKEDLAEIDDSFIVDIYDLLKG